MEDVLTKILGEEKTKFKDLVGYFKGLQEEDVLEQNVWDYVDYAEPKHKGLMEVLVRKHLEPYFDSLKQKREYFVPTKTEAKLYERKMLNGNRKILPANMDFLEKVTIKDVVEMDCDLDVVELIDLSENDLGDNDLYYILKLVQKLEKGKKLKDTVLNLSLNRIYGRDEQLKRIVREQLNSLVRVPEIKFVVLTANPFCTVDNKDFFQCIGISSDMATVVLGSLKLDVDTILPCDDILTKLIWVNNWDLFSSGWVKTMIYYQKVRKPIRITHLRYYQPENLLRSCQGELFYASKNNQVIFATYPKCSNHTCGLEINQKPENGDGHIVEHQGRLFITQNMGEYVGVYYIRDWETGN